MKRNAIKVEGLVKQYPGIDALKGLSFEVEEGAIHGFLGKNAAGKSTTLNILSGILKPTAGVVTFFDREIVDPSELNQLIGVLPDNPPLYGEMTALHYLEFCYELKNLPLSKKREALEKTISQFRLESVLARLVKNLSLGYKRRVAMASAFLGDPPIVILDEPTIALDPALVIELRSIILSCRHKQTVILSTHQLSEVEKYCTHVTIISEGRALHTGTIAEVLALYKKRRVLLITMELATELRTELENRYQLKLLTQEGDRYEYELLNESERQDEILKFIVTHGKLHSINEQTMDLEHIFKELEGKNE